MIRSSVPSSSLRRFMGSSTSRLQSMAASSSLFCLPLLSSYQSGTSASVVNTAAYMQVRRFHKTHLVASQSTTGDTAAQKSTTTTMAPPSAANGASQANMAASDSPSTPLTPEEEQDILKKSDQIQRESAKAEEDEKKKEQHNNQEDTPPNQSAYQRLMANLKGLSFKELVKQYGIPLAVFYWVTNESLVALLTYLFHYNYLTTGDVVDGLKYVGLDSLVNIETIHSTSITLWGVEISALFLTNFLVASAVMSLFTPIQVPLCIAVFPYLRNGVRRVLGRKTTATVAAAVPAAATATAV